MRTLLLLLLVLVLLAGYASWTVGRLDRLHARVDAAWSALDAALVRRAAAAREVVHLLPPGASADRLERAVVAALVGGPVAREAVENDLSQALRAALPLLSATGAEAVRAELDAAAVRVGLARSFHNSAVTDTRTIRLHRVPRALRLAGHRVLPQHFDIDDAALPAAPSAALPAAPPTRLPTVVAGPSSSARPRPARAAPMAAVERSHPRRLT